MLRWILPVGFFLLPAIGWLGLQGELAGMYDTRVGLTLFTSANVVVICTVLGLTARQADRLDNERQRAWVSLTTSEQRLREQQLEIRDLSTPVLQIRNRLLLLPIIGVLDSERAQQLTNNLLQMIRGKRAKIVVMDITGVAAVDSRTANHLIKTVTAAQLMGCAVIFTGLSAEVAQSLVALGVDLGTLNTVGDLQGGLDLAEQSLGACCDSGDEA
jgi:anti-anti-sigma regulatory factor